MHDDPDDYYATDGDPSPDPHRDTVHVPDDGDDVVGEFDPIASDDEVSS